MSMDLILPLCRGVEMEDVFINVKSPAVESSYAKLAPGKNQRYRLRVSQVRDRAQRYFPHQSVGLSCMLVSWSRLLLPIAALLG